MIAGSAAGQFAGETVNYNCDLVRVIDLQVNNTNIQVSNNQNPFIGMLQTIINGSEFQVNDNYAIFNTPIKQDSCVMYAGKDFEGVDDLILNPGIFIPLDIIENQVDLATLNTRNFAEPFMGTSLIRKNYKFNRNRFVPTRFG